MKAKRTTGFGLHDTARAIARRHQQATIDAETRTLPPISAAGAAYVRDLMDYARKFKKPLAA